MAIEEIQFHVLDVGQGACNYVEIFDDGGDVVANLLIDLGTNSSQAIAADNLEWLREKIENNGEYLDVLVITHGDTDHYNMIAKILPAFGDPDGNQIGMIRYGGPKWRYGGGNLIDTLDEYTDDMGSFSPSETGYDAEDEEWEPIWTDEDDEVKLQLIVANTPHPRDPASMKKKQSMNAEAVNTKSVVLGLEWDGYWIVATGDATSTTLAEVNGILGDVDSDDLPECFMLTLPHHGSRKTTYDLKNANDDVPDEDREVVDDFLNIFSPKSMSVSAGEKRHHHPSMLMVAQFAEHTAQDVKYWSDPALTDDRHFITCWIDLEITDPTVDPAWPPSWRYSATQTDQNVYSTFYFKDDPYNRKYVKAKGPSYYQHFVGPPLPADEIIANAPQTGVPTGRNWQFTMDETDLTVESSENEARAAAMAPDFTAMRGAPPAATFTRAGRQVRAMVGAPPRPAGPAPQPPRHGIDEPAGPRLYGLKVIA